MHLNALENGQPVHGVIVLREVFFIIVNILLVYISYRFIPVMEEFDRRTTDQRSVIEKQADQQRMINREIKERMSILVDQVDEQNLLIRGFNEKMQNQSATFEELSATLEELLSSAENIHVSSVDQIDGNVKMEEIVNEFKTIKVETTKNLKTTYDDIEGIVAKTSISNESLRDVERTIEKIKQQSGKIGETVSIIVDIADKINLLSLNAAIEAARAGDSGKGFAVVADEIGKLAYRTTESIKEIESVLRANTAITAEGVDVIKNTADMIKELIGDMASSSEKIKILQESILVEERFINIIIDQMFKNIELAKSIGVGTEEQKLAIESSTKAIEHVNEIVGEMVKEIRNLSVTSQKILENSTELMQKSLESVE
jgi:methyl-accepting chemotaxis protein